MKYITKHFKGYYKELILGPLFKLAEAVLELMVPVIMANIIDMGIPRRDTSYILLRGGLLLLLAAMGAVSGIICQYYAAKVAGKLGTRLRKEAFGQVMKFSKQDTERLGTGTGGLITRLTNDINQVQNGVNMVIRLGTRVPFLAVGSISMAFLIDRNIGFVFLGATLLITLTLVVIMRRTLPSYLSIQEGQDRLSRQSRESLSGVRVIRAFAKQEEEAEDYQKTAAGLTRLIEKAGRISAALNPLTNLIVNIAIGVIVWMGAGAVNRGTMESGKIVALVSYMNQTLLALMTAANLMVLFTRALASGKRVVAVLSLTPSIQALSPSELAGRQEKAALTKQKSETSKNLSVLAATMENSREIPPEKTAVSFRDVTFAYEGDGDAMLSRINFSVRPGEMLGIIGGTGSGKSSLIQLMMRNFDVNWGAVYVGGQDVRSRSPEALRAGIAHVPQKAVLFAGSIRENMQMAAGEVTDQEIWHGLTVAQGREFVAALPGGLDSPVEEGGRNFSGGQRQRLTIARALVRKAELLILDDAASALDLATDAALGQALRQEMADHPEMTVIVVAQRVSAIRRADQILVLDDGMQVGFGTHEALLKDNEVYREICGSQGMLDSGEVKL